MNMEKLINFSDWLWSGPLIAIILFLIFFSILEVKVDFPASLSP